MTNPDPTPTPARAPSRRGETLYRPPARDRRAARPADRRAHRAALVPFGRGQDLAGAGRAGARAGTRGLPRPARHAPRPAARRTRARRQPLRAQPAAGAGARAAGGRSRLPLAELAGLSLADYLEPCWPRPAEATTGTATCCIFDQFEEVLTVDPTDRDAKLAFFEQVGQALRDRNRWALFAMREEFVAALDPYLRPIPARFDKGRRYRLDLLGPDAAREAMQGPAADQDAAGGLHRRSGRASWPTTCGGCRCSSRTGRRGTTLGPYIEPVQLQVVCRRLWDNLAPDDMTIDLDDLAAVGDVDTALRGYYADTVAASRRHRPACASGPSGSGSTASSSPRAASAARC